MDGVPQGSTVGVPEANSADPRGVIDSVNDSSSPRAKLIEVLSTTVHTAAEAGDLFAAHIAREALAKLLSASDG